MSDHDLDTVLSWRGRTVRDPAGTKIGKLGALYLDGATDRPAYAGVHTGLFGRHESIVPLADARDQEGDIVVGYDAELVREAPNLDPDTVLSPEEEDVLSAHYATQADRTYGTEAPDTMLRSEEEVQVGVEELAPAERVRLRKVMVTEHVSQTVPVRREVIQLETEPPPEGTIESVEDVRE